MSLTNKNFLAAMGIDTWIPRDTPTLLCSAKKEDWNDLQTEIAACHACSLHQTRTQTVFGVGNPKADLMLIGEAPGFHEDQKGEPFVGRAGLLLDNMLKAIGLNREKVFIANILKCRPPNNRDPEPHEVTQCTPFLVRQIAAIQPKLLVALGRIAAHYLLNIKTPIGQIRGKTYSYGELKTPLIVTFHPAYLLRSPREKSKAFQDLQMIQQMLGAIPAQARE